eukprot:6833289-Prymnesium_polylepis.1
MLRAGAARLLGRHARRLSSSSSSSSSSCSSSSSAPNPTRHERNAFDTLAFSGQLEAAGVPRTQAEALARNVLDVIAHAEANNRAEFAFKEQIAHVKHELSTGLDNQRGVMQRDTDRL